MSYEEQVISVCRTPVTLVRLTLDWCGNVFGVAPCTASLELPPCYNTYHTCKARAAFVKTAKVYEFTSADAPGVPWPGPRPYLKSVTYLPTEITNTVTVSGRIKIELMDEPDGDVGVDPYVAQRPSVQGTYWKKWLARNPNYKGRRVEIFEGFWGDPFSEYRQRVDETLDSASLRGNVLTVQTVDLLKGLGEIEVPPQLDVSLLNEAAVDAVEMVLEDTGDVASLPDNGYVRIGDEIVRFLSIDRAQRKLQGCERGAMGSVAAQHAAKDAVQICRYLAPGNPFDHLVELLLVDAGLTEEQVDMEAIEYWRDWPGGEVPMTAFLDAPTKLSDLICGVNKQTSGLGGSADSPPDSYGLLDLLDCRIWVAENLKVTIARNIANAPGRTYRALSDEATVVSGSASVEMNESVRVVVTVLHWDKRATGAVDEPASYARVDIGVNGEARTEYGDSITEHLYCRWLKSGIIQEEVLDHFIADLLARRLFSRRDAAPIITLSAELKDSEVLTGSFVTLTTDELLNPDGSPIDTRFQVVRRDPKGNKLELKVQRMPVRRCAFFAPEGVEDYASATAEQREYGGFFSDELGLMPGGDAGFFFY